MFTGRDCRKCQELYDKYLRGSILCVFEKEADPERPTAALELIASNARFS